MIPDKKPEFTLWIIELTFAITTVMIDQKDIIIKTSPMMNWALHEHFEDVLIFYAKKKQLVKVREAPS